MNEIIEDFKEYLELQHNMFYSWVEADKGTQKPLFFEQAFYLCNRSQEAKYVCIFRIFKNEIDRGQSFKKSKGIFYYFNKSERYTATVYPYIPQSKNVEFKEALEPARK